MLQVDTVFSTFELSAEELTSARTLIPFQRAYYQTLLSSAAEEKLAIEFDPEHPLLSTRQEAYLRGQMDILNMLLAENGNRPKRYTGQEVAIPQPSTI